MGFIWINEVNYLLDLINREELFGKHKFFKDDCGKIIAAVPLKDIRECRATDAEEIHHGYWVDRGNDRPYLCSWCGGGCLLNYESDYHKSDRCPHCGCIMDLENNEVKTIE